MAPQVVNNPLLWGKKQGWTVKSSPKPSPKIWGLEEYEGLLACLQPACTSPDCRGCSSESTVIISDWNHYIKHSGCNQRIMELCFGRQHKPQRWSPGCSWGPAGLQSLPAHQKHTPKGWPWTWSHPASYWEQPPHGRGSLGDGHKRNVI